MRRRLAKRARSHLNYATVVTAISVFLLLAGGAAYAAGHLAKNSVGTKQLKKNAVTVAKIKTNAVTTAKIRDSAVTATKIKAGSIPGSSFDLSTTPYSRIVHVAKSTGPVTAGGGQTLVPLDAPTYTQAAGEDDAFFGVATVAMPPGCEGAVRSVRVKVSLDAADPLSADLSSGEVVSDSLIDMPKSGQASETASLQSDGWAFAPAAATSHTLAVTGEAQCSSGTETAVVESLEIDVVGTR